jgi:hypothetical protein
MSIEDRFDAALADQDGPAEVELLPVRLARACTSVLPVAGAGLSALTHPDLRLPIRSSDDVAAYAERASYTPPPGTRHRLVGVRLNQTGDQFAVCAVPRQISLRQQLGELGL